MVIPSALQMFMWTRLPAAKQDKAIDASIKKGAICMERAGACHQPHGKDLKYGTDLGEKRLNEWIHIIA